MGHLPPAVGLKLRSFRSPGTRGEYGRVGGAVGPDPESDQKALRGPEGPPHNCLICVVLAVLLLNCGYVGDPEPPALRIPVPVTDLAAVQRGGNLIVQFNVPHLTTEGLVIEEYGEIDLRVGAEGVSPYHQATWEDYAQRIEAGLPDQASHVRVEVPVEPWVGREVLIGVQLANSKGRRSVWSNLMALNVIEAIAPPRDVTAAGVREGVKLTWTPEDAGGARYRILRRYGDGEAFVLTGDTESANWVDTNIEFGTSYEYRVQALVPAGDDFAESALAEPVAITPVDIFPPAVPQGLTVAPGFDSLELAWESVPDKDLEGYVIHRGEDGVAARIIAELVTSTAYSDHDVNSGTRYRYTLVSVDRSGNQSEESAAAEQVAP